MTQELALVGVWLAIASGAGEARADARAAQAEPAGEDGFVAPDQVFAERPPRGLAGAEVHLEDVPVRGKSGRGLWIGYSERRQAFVVPIDPSEVAFVAVGARVDVRGTLRETPAARQAAREFALDRAGSRRLAREPLYIEAWSISYL